MWFQFLLCLLVGLSSALQDPAWKENTEYTYSVHGRSLSGVEGVSNHYTGIVIRAKLIVQPQGTDRLRFKIVQPQYADVTTTLEEGWMSHIPDDNLSYQELEMTDKPFDAVMKNGVVKELIVEKEVAEWEANIIKSFVSQFQLDTSGENLVNSRLNILPKEGSNNAVFKVLEDTVTGITETSYDIHPLPEYILQSKPYLAPFPHLKGDGSIIEIVKSKNYTEGHELPSYTFGNGNYGKWKPVSNQFSYTSQRSSLGRAVVTGTLQRYTIQFSETINRIVVSLGHLEGEKGGVNSMVRIQLKHADEQNSRLPELSSPVNLGNLVYSYNKHSSQSVSPGRMFRRSDYPQYDHHSSEQEEHHSNYLQKRHPRSLTRMIREGTTEPSQDSVESEEDWTVPKAKLNEAPRFPLLPYSSGYKGQSIKHSEGFNVVEKAYEIAQQLGKELVYAKGIPQKHSPALARFVMLTSLLRIMDEQELKQVAERLYTQETDSEKYYTWIAFRDSVAEAGTGPAFLVIKYLLENNKVQHSEASTLMVTMEQACRQPTVEYIKAYFELMKKYMNPQQEVHHRLNETMLFSVSRLVNKAFVNHMFSHKEYPSHSFGKFDTQAGKNFVRKEYVPYLAKQLREAITDGDAQRIHAYIRALGEVGDHDIIYVLQPYLEGKIHCSQFQRFLMVIALRKVSEIEPKLVGPILYRIYQNIGETTEIRVAAVYMLMRTDPSSVMLQRIAQYTKYDDNNKVSAAVKTAIEGISKLRGREFAELRSAADSARFYLSEKKFAVQDPAELLLSYASENWEGYYRGILATVVAEDSGLPTSFYSSLQFNDIGYLFNRASVDALVSDIRNLFRILEQKTEWYKSAHKRQTSSQKSEKSKWSSHRIARLLNLQTDELEQLEGGIFVQLGEIQKHLLFNNQTLQGLPKMLEEFQSSLEQGKHVRYNKIINSNEAAIAFPTEIGLPFVYTYDSPVHMRVEGIVKGKIEPKLSDGVRLRTPDYVEMEAEIKATYWRKNHVEFGVFAPFNHYHYSAGYDQNTRVNLPMKIESKMDFKNKKIQYEIEPLEDQEDLNIFHMGSSPYVSRHDILTLKPTSERKGTHIIRRRIQNQLNHVYGEKAVGMAFHVEYENDYKHPSIYALLKGNVFGTNVQYEQINVNYVPSKSQNKKMHVSVSYDMQKRMTPQTATSGKDLLKKLLDLPLESQNRISQLGDLVGAGTDDSAQHVLDARVEFLGKQHLQFIGSLGYARNSISSKSRVFVTGKKLSQIPGSAPFEGALTAKFNMVPMSGLDMEYNMRKDIKSTVDIDFAFGDKQPVSNQGEIHATLSRTDSRKKYLMNLPQYRKCETEIRQGNRQQLACANMTQMAGLFDLVKIDVKYPSMHSENLVKILHKYNELASGPFYDFKIEQSKQPKQQPGEISVGVKFYPDFERVNVSVASHEKYAYIKNIPLNDWARRVVVVHQGFNAFDRVKGKLLGYETYKPFCTLDKTEAYTFDGTSYPLYLRPYWTVALQYVPQRSYDSAHYSVEEQLEREIENYVVLVRQSSQRPELREAKIVAATSRTDGKVIEVTLKPKRAGQYPQVFVDGTPVAFTNAEQSKTYQNQVTVTAIANGEIYVHVHGAFHVVYDESRVKITPDSITGLRNRLRGICGNFEGRPSNDFVTPSNCIVRDPNELVASYTVLKEGEQNQEVMDLKRRSQTNHCVYKKIPTYTNYVSPKDEHRPSNQPPSCSKYQTRYIMDGAQICFTIRPLTTCKEGCNQNGLVHKNVEVHCVENKNVASLWKSQIDKGASPDFSQKPVTKSMPIEVPQSCISR